jgi:TolB protein
MQVFLSNPYEGTGGPLTTAPGENSLPAWSPDGKRIAFVTTRHGEGNSEIYVMNADGSNQVRLTNHPEIDTSPTWSPSGTHIAFVSGRTGRPQLYVVGTDGLGLQQLTSESWADRPTWSPAPYNEIAFAAQAGAGFEIKIMDFQTRRVTQLTGLKNGEGSNESPAFSPNGRHIAFTSTRAGKEQIFTMTRDGRDVRQITRQGNNRQANWSTAPPL